MINNNYLLILGSQNANPLDRFFKRNQIHPVQLLNHKNEIIPLTYFDSWGELGVASTAWDWKYPNILFISTGSDLIKLDITKGVKTIITISDLKDVHEITFINSFLWIANTGNDEVIQYNIEKDKVEKRIRLKELISPLNVNSIKTKYVEKFHCNQVFKSINGSMYVLVHHCKGLQYKQKTITTIIKLHGNGGILNLETGNTINLRLRAPHTVRIINSMYWIFDSRRHIINIYSLKWKLIKKLQISGLGRGADSIGNYFYAGISPIRKRYLSYKSNIEVNNCSIDVININNLRRTENILINNIEQINNIYKISEFQFRSLLKL